MAKALLLFPFFHSLHTNSDNSLKLSLIIGYYILPYIKTDNYFNFFMFFPFCLQASAQWTTQWTIQKNNLAMKPCKSNVYSVLYKGVGNYKHYFNMRLLV